ncbi:phenylacetyl-CoA ligase [Amanita muscaria]
MSIIHPTAPPLVPFPDNVTIPQFFLDGRVSHPTEPIVAKDIPCMIDESNGRRIYLSELRTRADYLARTLKQKWQLDDGSIVALISPNHIDYGVCCWAAHRVGGSVALVNPSLTEDEIAYHFQLAMPALVISFVEVYDLVLKAASNVDIPKTNIIVLDNDGNATSTSTVPTIAKLINEGMSFPPIEDTALAPREARIKMAFLCFSSGTTGKPKAVMISHYNIICNVLQWATFARVNDPSLPKEQIRHGPGDVCTGVVPLYHIYGVIFSLHFAIHTKATIVLAQKFDFGKMLASIRQYRISHLLIVPPMAILISKHPAAQKADLSSIKFCLIGGAPVSAELSKRILARMPDIQLLQAYGMTETCGGVSITPVNQKVGTLGSGGQLLSGTTAKVVKPDGTLAKVGEPGELYVHGGQVTLGYYQNPTATREAFIAGGWIRTGDEVIFKENGDLFIIDRLKELIKVKASQVAPAELEGHLLEHPDVADVGVIGVPDDYSGELPFAYIVLQPQLAELVKKDAKLAARIKERLSKHVSSAKSKEKWLAGGIEFIDVVPKSQSGKILRRLLREKAAESLRMRAKL